MRHVATDALVDPPAHSRITDFLLMQAGQDEDPHLYTVLAPEGAAREVRAREFLAAVQGVAKGLVAAGIEPGDRVGILSRTRYEWTLADLAIWYAGAVPVPVYDSSSAQQIAWIMGDSDAKAVFVETQALEDSVLAASRETPFRAAENVWRLDGTGTGLDEQDRLVWQDPWPEVGAGGFAYTRIEEPRHPGREPHHPPRRGRPLQGRDEDRDRSDRKAPHCLIPHSRPIIPETH